MSQELQTIIDLIRYGASRFNAAGLTFGHSYDNALDEATQLTLHALHLPHDLPPAYGNARITEAEKEDVLALFLRRIEERIPAAYLAGEASADTIALVEEFIRLEPEMARTVEDPSRHLNKEIAQWMKDKDLIIEGVNMLSSERTEIGAMLDQNGGSIDKLVAQLNKS